MYCLNLVSGEKAQMISSEVPIEYVCPSPTGDYLLFVTRSEESEINTIHLLNPLTQKEKILYQGQGDAGRFPFWSEDGQRIYYISKEECQAFPSTFYNHYFAVTYHLKDGVIRHKLVI